MQINPLMTSYSRPNVDEERCKQCKVNVNVKDVKNVWWRKISRPVCIRNVDSLQEDSTKCAPQYELNSFVTIATY